MNKNLKRYLVSSLVTFLTGFCIAFVAQIDTITWESIGNGALVGLGFTAIRAGIKAVMEFFIAKFAAK